MSYKIKCLKCNSDVIISIPDSNESIQIFCESEVCDNHFPKLHIKSIKDLLEYFSIYDDFSIDDSIDE